MRNPVRNWLAITPCLATLFLCSANTRGGELSFSRDIRPILSNNCFICHGPDEQTREGGFRFDIKQSAIQPADSGEIPIVPGDLDASEIWNRIQSTDESSRMPPPDQEKQLTEEDRQKIRLWIEQGAKWEEHWSFTPLVRPTPPEVQHTEQIDSPVDQFILAELETRGRKLARKASKQTLIRRLSLDMTGLPPTPEEIDEFVNDKSPDAYEKVVDRLLSSRHYGEQMATSWLDGARFADTNGYQNDFKRSMWPWRDWVINAFNSNMPFDQFTVEQLAGDLLEDPTSDQIIATGFNRNNRTVTEFGSIDAEWLVENVVDRVETTSAVFLGLTLGCARCHDHKYDPVTQREFYQMYAYFHNVAEKGVYPEMRGNVAPVHVVLTKDEQDLQDELIARVELAKAEIARWKQVLPDQQSEWEKSFSVGSTVTVSTATDSILSIAATGADDRLGNAPNSVKHSVNERVQSNSKDDVFASAVSFSGKQTGRIDLGDAIVFDARKPFSATTWVYAEENGMILSRMDKDQDYRGFDCGILDNGQVVVHLIHRWPSDALKFTTKQMLKKSQWNHVAVTYDGSKKVAGFQVFLNSQPATLKIESDKLVGDTLVDHPVWLGHRVDMPFLKGQLSDLHVFDRSISLRELDAIFESSLHRVRCVKRSDRSQQQQAVIDRAFRDHFATEYAGARRRLAKAEREQAEFVAGKPSVMVMKERPQPRETFVLIRGQYNKPDRSQKVSPGIPAFLPQPPDDAPSNRLGLARWIVSEDNPLTARVAVNRVWHQLFGVGIVESSENFGIQCPPPLHRDLLDWLAADFRENGWDLKALLKSIVMTSTYMQSSDFDPSAADEDPNNVLFGRGPRFRLSSEEIRDNALAISGLLSPNIGGPSIKPYQPDGIWDELAGGAGEGKYIQDKGEKLYRRSLYIYRKRTVPHPTMVTFDAPSREICQVARQRTNTPLQALALLNDTTYVEASRHLATLAINATDSKIEQIEFAFRRATGRRPHAREVEILNRAYERYFDYFETDQDSAKQLVSLGESDPPTDIGVVSLAALTNVASTILNLDETITKN